MTLWYIAAAAVAGYAAFKFLEAPSPGLEQSRRDDARVLAALCGKRGFSLIEEALVDFAEGEDLTLERVRSGLRRMMDDDGAAQVVLPVFEKNIGLVTGNPRHLAVVEAAFAEHGFELKKAKV